MEINSVGKALLVAEAMAPNLDGLDAAVDALGRSVADLQNDGVQGAPEAPHRRSEGSRPGTGTQTRQAAGWGPDDGQGASGDAHRPA